MTVVYPDKPLLQETRAYITSGGDPSPFFPLPQSPHFAPPSHRRNFLVRFRCALAPSLPPLLRPDVIEGSSFVLSPSLIHGLLYVRCRLAFWHLGRPYRSRRLAPSYLFHPLVHEFLSPLGTLCAATRIFFFHSST